MDDRHIVAVEGRHVVLLQGGNGLLDHLHGQLAGGVHVLALRHGGLGAAGHGGAEQHVVAGRQLIAHHGIHGHARLCAQQLGGLHDHIVNGGQIQHVGHAHEVAVLRHGGGQAGHVQRAAVGGHTFRQGGQRLGQLVELAELNGLTAALGDVALLAELAMHQIGACLTQQHLVIEGFHFRRQVVAGGVGAGGVGHISKQLHVQRHHKKVFNGFHKSPFRRGQKQIFSPLLARWMRSSISLSESFDTSLFMVTPAPAPFSVGRWPCAWILAASFRSVS